MGWFGDGIYIAEHGILAKKKKPSNRNLTTCELLYNARIDHYRARAEHIIAHVKTHGFFKTACRLERPQVEGMEAARACNCAANQASWAAVPGLWASIPF